MRLTLLSASLALTLLPALPAQEPVQREKPVSLPRPAVPPVVGSETRHRVKRGETLRLLAVRYATDVLTLARLNGISPAPRRLKPGRVLRLPTRFILPKHPQDGLTLDIPERAVYLFKNGALARRLPTAIGRANWQTPAGIYFLQRKVKNPVWLPPEVMVRREGAIRRAIPPGPGNPIGDRWMGWSRTQVGFHTTYAADSIGQAGSHGCARMRLEDGHWLFEQVTVGMPIYAVYDPVKIGAQGRTVFLSVSPDPYGKGGDTLTQIERNLRQAGVQARVDRAALRRIAARQDGYPYAIATLSGERTERKW